MHRRLSRYSFDLLTRRLLVVPQTVGFQLRGCGVARERLGLFLQSAEG
jgi:hypothetical protein